jgi:hypothetical protein
MSWIGETLTALPVHWALLSLVIGIGLAVVLVRGLIRLAVRVILFGAIGVALMGVIYFLW